MGQIKIYDTYRNVVGEPVATADQIKDTTLNKDQSLLNALFNAGKNAQGNDLIPKLDLLTGALVNYIPILASIEYISEIDALTYTETLPTPLTNDTAYICLDEGAEIPFYVKDSGDTIAGSWEDNHAFFVGNKLYYMDSNTWKTINCSKALYHYLADLKALRGVYMKINQQLGDINLQLGDKGTITTINNKDAIKFTDGNNEYFAYVTVLENINKVPNITTTTLTLVSGNANFDVGNIFDGATVYYSIKNNNTWSSWTAVNNNQIVINSRFNALTTSNTDKVTVVKLKAVKNGRESNESNEITLTIQPTLDKNNKGSVAITDRDGDSVKVQFTPSTIVGATNEYSEDSGNSWHTYDTAFKTSEITTVLAAKKYKTRCYGYGVYSNVAESDAINFKVANPTITGPTYSSSSAFTKNEYATKATYTITKSPNTPNSTMLEYVNGAWVNCNDTVIKEYNATEVGVQTVPVSFKFRSIKSNLTEAEFPASDAVLINTNITLNRLPTIYGVYSLISDSVSTIKTNLVAGGSIEETTLKPNTLYLFDSNAVTENAYVYILCADTMDVNKIKHKASDFFGAGFISIKRESGYNIYRSTEKWLLASIDSIILNTE